MFIEHTPRGKKNTNQWEGTGERITEPIGGHRRKKYRANRRAQEKEILTNRRAQGKK